jgi:hypothetical protein
MRPTILFILLFFIFSKESFEQEIPSFNYSKDFKRILDSTQDNNSSLSYEKLLIRFLNNDSTLSNPEVLALMIGFTEDPQYRPLEDMQSELEIFDHTNNGEFSDALFKARNYLETHPLSLLINRELSYTYHELGLEHQKNFMMEDAIRCQDSAKYYMDLNNKIMEAMIYSGKGRTPENPIFSLGLSDGEYFIPNIGYVIESDGVKQFKDVIWNKNGECLEVINALINNIDVKKFYFVIQHAKIKIDDDKASKLDENNKKKKKKTTKKKSTEKITDKKSAIKVPGIDKEINLIDSVSPTHPN